MGATVPDPSEGDRLVSEIEYEIEFMTLEAYEMAVRVAREIESEINAKTSGTRIRIEVNKASRKTTRRDEL